MLAAIELNTSLLLLLLYLLSGQQADCSSEWNYKFTYTASVSSQMSIACEANNAIWIGWSHYGTRSVRREDLVAVDQVINL